MSEKRFEDLEMTSNILMNNLKGSIKYRGTSGVSETTHLATARDICIDGESFILELRLYKEPLDQQ